MLTHSGSAWTPGPDLQNGEGTSDERYEAEFGVRLALSASGTSALIGSEGGYPGSGFPAGAWVFNRSGSTWTQLAGKLKCDARGCGVALSGDANTALVGTAVYADRPPQK
jgi:hypothetical protein